MQRVGPLILPPAHQHSIWNQISIGVTGGRPSRWALSARGKFFICFDSPLVLSRMARPGAHVGKGRRTARR